MILIIPDIHGRKFWKDAVNIGQFDKIVFLGDYLDPYTFDENITAEEALDNFKDILEFKKANYDNVELLIGNHDCCYLFSRMICDCRADHFRYNEIQELFNNNRDLFNFVYDTKINGKLYIFSHAGIHNKYAYTLFGKDADDVNNLKNLFNSAYKSNNKAFISSLSIVSQWRGGYEHYGSIVWADIREWLDGEDYDNCFQIVGHTRCQQPILFDNMAMLDSISNAYILTDEGKITTLDGKFLITIRAKMNN